MKSPRRKMAVEVEVARALECKFPGVRFAVKMTKDRRRVAEVVGYGLPAWRALDFAREFGILAGSGRWREMTREGTEIRFYTPVESSRILAMGEDETTGE